MRAILLTGIVLVACTSPKTGNLLPGGPGDAGGGPSRVPGGPSLEADAGAGDVAQLVDQGAQLEAAGTLPADVAAPPPPPPADAGLPPIPDAGLARDTLDPVAMDRCQLYVETLCGWEAGCVQGNRDQLMNLCRERFRMQLDRCNRVGSTDGWQKCEHQLLNPPGDCTVLVRDGRVVVPADCAGVLYTRP